MFIFSGELIVSKYVAESITMIAGRFGHEGLCQLCTCVHVNCVWSWPKHPTIIIIDSATYLLMISSPDIDKVAMSLYNIMFIFQCSSLALLLYLGLGYYRYSSWSFCGMRISMSILIAMSSYLCVWIGICTAIIEQPSVCGVMPSYSNSLCTCVCVCAYMHVCVCVCMGGVTIAC